MGQLLQRKTSSILDTAIVPDCEIPDSKESRVLVFSKYCRHLRYILQKPSNSLFIFSSSFYGGACNPESIVGTHSVVVEPSAKPMSFAARLLIVNLTGSPMDNFTIEQPIHLLVFQAFTPIFADYVVAQEALSLSSNFPNFT